MRLVREGYFTMQNVRHIDNQQVTKSVVEMWYTKHIKSGDAVAAGF